MTTADVSLSIRFVDNFSAGLRSMLPKLDEACRAMVRFNRARWDLIEAEQPPGWWAEREREAVAWFGLRRFVKRFLP